MKVKDKFVLCKGCNHKYTINYTSKEKEKESKCTNCGKVNKHKVNEHIISFFEFSTNLFTKDIKK